MAWQFAVHDFAERTAVLARDTDGLAALLRDAGVVDQQEPSAIGSASTKLLPDRPSIPSRVRDEVLQRLVLPRIEKPLEHALHVLPLRVAKQALQVAQRVARLPASYESAREAIEELRQSLQQVELDRAQPPSRTAMSVLVQANVRRTAGRRLTK